MNIAKHRWMLWVGAACLSVACSEKPEGSSAALYGVGNLVSAEELVFTLSTDKSELRVLDLNSSDRVRGPHFMPAINPLEPLSIPVLTYPNILASDLRWEELEGLKKGKTVGGPFIYVASHGRRDISIVGGSREWLKELKRFPTAEPVTALAAHRGESYSTLFFATYDGSEGRLWALDLEGEQTVDEASIEALSARQLHIQSYPEQVITALSILPEGELAVAVRGVGSAPSALYLLDNTQVLQEKIELQQAFRMLATHAAFDTLPAGRWLYALLDEGSCEAALCGSGIVALDMETGDWAPTRAMPSVGGMPIALGFVPVTLNGTERLAGLYVTGSGLMGMFDAATLLPFEAAKAVSVAFFSPGDTGELAEVDYIEGPLLNEDGTPNVKVADGATLDETVLIGIESLIPGWVDLPTADSDGRYFPAGAADMSRAQAGDLLEIFVGDTLCAELVVESIDEVNRALLAEGAIPSACSGRTHFHLRAGAGTNKSYVVAGTKTGYMGRTGAGERFEYGASSLSPPADPILTIEFGVDFSDKAIRNARWELVLASGYAAHGRDIQNFSDCSTRIAAGVWVDSVRRRAYVSFSSSNALIEVDTNALVDGSLGEAELTCYR
ncbi:MAG: hypothetical protein FWG75_01615 [Cystobacterineae bacterium]|nr:hypothetical protein [Cystobacterineae bacterium]